MCVCVLHSSRAEGSGFGAPSSSSEVIPPPLHSAVGRRAGKKAREQAGKQAKEQVGEQSGKQAREQAGEQTGIVALGTPKTATRQ